MTAAWPQEISCSDAHDRISTVAVDLRDGHVVQTVPPGEAAKYTAPQLSRLIDVLQRARAELYRRDA